MDWADRAFNSIERDYDNGVISTSEYEQQIRELLAEIRDHGCGCEGEGYES